MWRTIHDAVDLRLEPEELVDLGDTVLARLSRGLYWIGHDRAREPAGVSAPQVSTRICFVPGVH